ncbi:hypothetical protein C8Q80DRAFT_1274169 [Daedaleopsis nitida]|nr:hypothetical protein C8Q80DRAFT_1274169 [Daedaleopsis nitida]
MSQLYPCVTPGSWCYDHDTSKCHPLELDAFSYSYHDIQEQSCPASFSDEALAAQSHLSGPIPRPFGHPFEVFVCDDVLFTNLQFLSSHPLVDVGPSDPYTLPSFPTAPGHTHVSGASGTPFQQGNATTGLPADSDLSSGTSQASHDSLQSQTIKELSVPLEIEEVGTGVETASDSPLPFDQQSSRSTTVATPLRDCGRLSAQGWVLDTSPQFKLRLTSYTPVRTSPHPVFAAAPAFPASPPGSGSFHSPTSSTSQAFPSASAGSGSGSRPDSHSDSRSPSPGSPSSSSASASQSSPHVCPHCSAPPPTFGRALDLTRHIRSVHESLPTAWLCCGIPLAVARTRPEIPPHVLAETPRMYDGQLMVGGCGTQNSRKDVLRRHLKRNAGRCFGDANGAWLVGNKLTGRRGKKAEASVRGTRKPAGKARKAEDDGEAGET